MFNLTNGQFSNVLIPFADSCTPNREGKRPSSDLKFAADLVIVPSLSEEEMVSPFLDYLRQVLTDNSIRNAVVTHCGDSRFFQGNFLERSSVVLYLFTNSSTEKFSAYTQIPGFQEFLYKKRFIPVLGEKDVKLSMPACVQNPLEYWRDDKMRISSMVVSIYEKHRRLRLERGNCQSVKENTCLSKRKSEVSVVGDNRTPEMHINADIVVIGDYNIVTTNPSNNEDDKDVRNRVTTSQSRDESDEDDVFTHRGTKMPLPVRLNSANNTQNGRSQSIDQTNSENTLEKTLHSTSNDETLEKQVFQSPKIQEDHFTSKNEEYKNFPKEKNGNQSSSSSDSIVNQYQLCDMKKSIYIRDNTLGFCCTKNATATVISNNLSDISRNFIPEFPPNIPNQSELSDREPISNERNESNDYNR